ncbi:MAG: AMP-binding protein [Flavisolibacter sp.]
MFQSLFTQPGSKTFLQTEEKNYSYKWLHQRISQVSGLLQSLQLKTGSRLLLAVSDEVEMSAIFLSALVNGITIVVADPEWKAMRAHAIIERSAPDCIIADKESLDAWKWKGSSFCRIIPYTRYSGAKAGLLSRFLQKSKVEPDLTHYNHLLENAEPLESLPPALAPETLAYIIFTSGTTADSKGVAITHGNLGAHLATLKKVYGLEENSTLLNQLLLCHADGCIQGPVLSAYAGCTWHRPFRFSIEKIPALLDYCYANSLSHLFMVPAMLNMLIQFSENYEDSLNYPQFRALISVSAHLEAPLWDQFESIFKVRVSNVYGLTETVAGSLFSGPLESTYRKYTVGRPVDCEIRILNELHGDAEPEEVGELCLKGEHIMPAYWNDPQMTAECFRDGWFYTGDLASIDKEGFVKIRGRKKNLIISGGINIQPEEITECLLHHPAVSEACAIGLPDTVFGEKLAAAVVVKQDQPVTSIDLVSFCREHLEEKKVPTKIFIMTELPKGVSGKVQLGVLREQLQQLQPARQEIHGQQLEQVLAIAAEVFQVPSNRLSVNDTSNTVAGWDSLAHLVFITSLEENFNISFSTAEVITMNSIQKAVNLIQQKHVPQNV